MYIRKTQREYKGKTYYFCSNKCKTMFDKNRDKFSKEA